jgi:hypothetical protein
MVWSDTKRKSELFWPEVVLPFGGYENSFVHVGLQFGKFLFILMFVEYEIIDR